MACHFNQNNYRGYLRNNRNLNYSEISEIRKLFENGMTINQLSETFDVNLSTIHRQLNSIFSKEELEDIKKGRKDFYKKTELQKDISDIKNLLLEIKMFVLGIATLQDNK